MRVLAQVERFVFDGGSDRCVFAPFGSTQQVRHRPFRPQLTHLDATELVSFAPVLFVGIGGS